jgi:hypothetical protein
LWMITGGRSILVWNEPGQQSSNWFENLVQIIVSCS